jgi:hypothetical protein
MLLFVPSEDFEVVPTITEPKVDYHVAVIGVVYINRPFKSPGDDAVEMTPPWNK